MPDNKIIDEMADALDQPQKDLADPGYFQGFNKDSVRNPKPAGPPEGFDIVDGLLQRKPDPDQPIFDEASARRSKAHHRKSDADCG